jgi:hypothetical protein
MCLTWTDRPVISVRPPDAGRRTCSVPRSIWPISSARLRAALVGSPNQNTETTIFSLRAFNFAAAGDDNDTSTEKLMPPSMAFEGTGANSAIAQEQFANAAATFERLIILNPFASGGSHAESLLTPQMTPKLLKYSRFSGLPARQERVMNASFHSITSAAKTCSVGHAQAERLDGL